MLGLTGNQLSHIIPLLLLESDVKLSGTRKDEASGIALIGIALLLELRTMLINSRPVMMHLPAMPFFSKLKPAFRIPGLVHSDVPIAFPRTFVQSFRKSLSATLNLSESC